MSTTADPLGNYLCEKIVLSELLIQLGIKGGGKWLSKVNKWCYLD